MMVSETKVKFVMKSSYALPLSCSLRLCERIKRSQTEHKEMSQVS
jgi:hypothetical protein